MKSKNAFAILIIVIISIGSTLHIASAQITDFSNSPGKVSGIDAPPDRSNNINEVNSSNEITNQNDLNGISGANVSNLIGPNVSNGVNATKNSNNINGLSILNDQNVMSGINGVNEDNSQDVMSGINKASSFGVASGLNGVNGLNGVSGLNGINGLNGVSGDNVSNRINGQNVMSGVNSANSSNDQNDSNRNNALNGISSQGGTLDDSQQSTTLSLIMDNGTLDCKAIASKFNGISIPRDKVCDVLVVRHSPQITGMNNINMNQFSLMNSLLEFVTIPNNSNNTNLGTTTTGASQVYVMGDFSLLETEMYDVLSVVKNNGWTVTGIHNHMINETPKMSMMHWETQGDINKIINQTNDAFAKTSIKS